MEQKRSVSSNYRDKIGEYKACKSASLSICIFRRNATEIHVIDTS